MEIMTEQIHMGISVFAGMVFFVWILPGMVCSKEKLPEDMPSRK